MTTAYEDNEARERAYRAECIKRGSELLTARDAGALFGVNESAIHVAKNEGRLRPFFVLAHRDTPLYWLVTLREYFAGRAEPDPELLEKMRSHGLTCWVSNSDGIGGGGWVLLSEKPGLRSWNEAADVLQAGARRRDRDARPARACREGSQPGVLQAAAHERGAQRPPCGPGLSEAQSLEVDLGTRSTLTK